MRSKYFYSKEELDDMCNTLLSGGKISDMITAHSTKWDRTYVGTRRRMASMAYDLNISRANTSPKFTEVAVVQKNVLNKSDYNRSSRYYTDEQCTEMINVLSTSSAPVRRLAKPLADKYNRSLANITMKMAILAKSIDRPVVQEPAKIKVVKTKGSYFYSNEEIEDMRIALSKGNKSVRTLIKEHAKKWNRGITGVSHKMYQVAKDIGSPRTKIHVDKKLVKKKTIKKLVSIKEEVPQTLGIDVPEGTSFDIKNVKRVVLQKKSLTIYF